MDHHDTYILFSPMKTHCTTPKMSVSLAAQGDVTTGSDHPYLSGYSRLMRRARRLGSSSSLVQRVLGAWMILSLGSLSAALFACSEPPLCVPGRVESCPCLPSGQGVQRCAEDGAHFLPCECSAPIPMLQAETLPSLSSQPRANTRSATASTLSSLVASGPQASQSSQPDRAKVKGATQPKVEAITEERSQSTRDEAKQARASESRGSRDESPFKRRRAKLVALEMRVEDSPTKSTDEKQRLSGRDVFKQKLRNQQRDWWFYSGALKRCVLTQHQKRGSRTPQRLISEGCYPHLDNGEEMIVRCEDSPLGPRTYHFTESEALCKRSQSRAASLGDERSLRQGRPKISALAPVINESPTESPSNASRQDLNSSPARVSSQGSSTSRSWYCLCYQERVQGVPTHATACRPSREMCDELTRKVKRGSSILVPDSVSVTCQERRGIAPWKTFKKRGANRALWRPSSHPGAWWSPGGCFLPGGPASLVTQNKKRSVQTKRASGGSKRVSKRVSQEPVAPIRRERMTSRELARFSARGSAPRSTRCVESCRANLVSSSMRQYLYGVRDVPKSLRWGSKYSDRVRFIKTTCLRTQPSGQRNEQICVDQVIQKCAKYCERAS